MVGIEVLILHVCQLCLQLGQVLSGLPDLTPVPVGREVFIEASALVRWASATSHHVSQTHPHRSSSVASTSCAVEAAEVLRACTIPCTVFSFS